MLFILPGPFLRLPKQEYRYSNQYYCVHQTHHMSFCCWFLTGIRNLSHHLLIFLPFKTLTGLSWSCLLFSPAATSLLLAHTIFGHVFLFLFLCHSIVAMYAPCFGGFFIENTAPFQGPLPRPKTDRPRKAGAWALQLHAPASFGFTSPCAVQDGPTDRAAGPSRVGDTPRPRRG